MEDSGKPRAYFPNAKLWRGRCVLALCGTRKTMGVVKLNWLLLPFFRVGLSQGNESHYSKGKYMLEISVRFSSATRPLC